MTIQTTSATLRANGREALNAVRSKASEIRTTGLPKAAAATDQAGRATASAALSASRALASLLDRRASTAGNLVGGAALLQALPMLRASGRLLRRHPALIAASAGAALAVIGYAAWQRRGTA
jgi:hypothetical protein